MCLLVLLSGCAGADLGSTRAHYGPWQALATNDASGAGLALLHSDGTVEICAWTIPGDRFRQLSGVQAGVMLAPDGKIQLNVMGRTFFVSVGQPLLIEGDISETDHFKMVKIVNEKPEIFRLSMRKGENDRIPLSG